MTLGIKRKIATLTIAAFVEMRSRGDSKLNVSHFKVAHSRHISSVSKADTSALCQQSVNGNMVRGRKDLWCPFGDEYNRFDLTHLAVDLSNEKGITETLLRHQLTPSERKLVKSFGKSTDPASVEQSGSKVRAKISRSKSEISASELLANTIRNRQNTQ